MINHIKNFVRRINYQINATLVRVKDSDNKNLGIISLNKAINIAKQLNCDLVEINPLASPPVCKIINYKKYLYELSKIKKKKKKNQTKEIKFRPFINTFDYNIKLKKILTFINKDNKVKIIIKFKGRESLYYKDSFIIFEKIKNDLNHSINIEYISKKLDNNQLIMIINHKKK